jgi:hypothetical protein
MCCCSEHYTRRSMVQNAILRWFLIRNNNFLFVCRYPLVFNLKAVVAWKETDCSMHYICSARERIINALLFPFCPFINEFSVPFYAHTHMHGVSEWGLENNCPEMENVIVHFMNFQLAPFISFHALQYVFCFPYLFYLWLARHHNISSWWYCAWTEWEEIINWKLRKSKWIFNYHNKLRNLIF